MCVRMPCAAAPTEKSQEESMRVLAGLTVYTHRCYITRIGLKQRGQMSASVSVSENRCSLWSHAQLKWEMCDGGEGMGKQSHGNEGMGGGTELGRWNMVREGKAKINPFSFPTGPCLHSSGHLSKQLTDNIINKVAEICRSGDIAAEKWNDRKKPMNVLYIINNGEWSVPWLK